MVSTSTVGGITCYFVHGVSTSLREEDLKGHKRQRSQAYATATRVHIIRHGHIASGNTYKIRYELITGRTRSFSALSGSVAADNKRCSLLNLQRHDNPNPNPCSPEPGMRRVTTYRSAKFDIGGETGAKKFCRSGGIPEVGNEASAANLKAIFPPKSHYLFSYGEGLLPS